MSKFKFADQLGFSPPIVFEEDTGFEEGFFTWPIDFEALGKDLASGTPIPYYYKNYEADRQTIVIKDEVGGDQEIDYESQIPMKIDSSSGEKRSLQLVGKLNKKLGTVSIRQHKVLFDFKLELGKSISFVKKIKYAHQDEVAIELTSGSYEDYSALSNYIGARENEQVRNKIINAFNKAFRSTSEDEELLKWLYQRAPRFVISQRGDEQLVKDLKLLTAYDLDSWFIDTGSAILNIMYGFNDLTIAYNDFKKHPEDVLRIYNALSDAKKVDFTTFITSIASFISGEASVAKFLIGKNYIVDSNLSVTDSQNTVFLQQYTYREGATVTTSAGGVGFPGGSMSIGTSKIREVVQQIQTKFNPLDLIALEDEVTGDIRFLSALEVKFFSNETEWNTIITGVAIIATVVATLVSFGVLGAGATGIVAVIAVTEIAVGLGDLILIFRKARLKGTEEGDWFIENWEKISIATAVVSISSAIRQGVIKNGPKTLARLRRLKGAKAAAIRERIRVLLFNAIINVEIANFGKVSFKIVPFESIRAINGLSITIQKAQRLWNLNVLVLDAIVDGKLVYALYYRGQVIASGAAKEINGFIKNKIFTHAAKDQEILKFLDELLEIEKLGLRLEAGNWFWKNASGVELRWAKLSEKVILENINKAFKSPPTIGAKFEAEVAKKMFELAKRFGDEITDFSNNVTQLKPQKRLNGDIDFGTKQYIIEAKSQLHNSHNIEQLKVQMQKYLPINETTSLKYMNPFKKKVVVVYDNLGTFNFNNIILKELKDQGVIFIEGVNNLKKLY